MGRLQGEDMLFPLELENSIVTVQYPDHQGHDLLIEIQKNVFVPPSENPLMGAHVHFTRFG